MSKESIFGTRTERAVFELRLDDFFNHTNAINRVIANSAKLTPSQRLLLIRKEAHSILNLADDIELKLLLKEG